MKILLVRAELFRADWQTDRHDGYDSHFPHFCEPT